MPGPVRPGPTRPGRDWSRAAVEAALERINRLHLGDDWCRDNDENQIDDDTPMVFPFHGLIFARFGNELFPAPARRLGRMI